MSSLLHIDQLSLAAPDGRILFSDLNLALNRETIGLVGRNGAGKSTLLRAIAGTVRPASGSITVSGRIGVLHQSRGSERESAADLLAISEPLAVLERIEKGEGSAQDFDCADWQLPARIDAALDEVELRSVDLHRPAASFSGGERMRLGLARLIIEAPDLILLDEPTNNLDDAGRALVGRLLGAWRGGALVASHDRALLDTVDRIVELSDIGVTQFGGGWGGFAAARAAQRSRAAAALDNARAALRNVTMDAQAKRERQARRDHGGRASAARGGAPRILLGMRQRRAEETAGRLERDAGAMLAGTRAVVDAASRQVERTVPLAIQLGTTGVHADEQLLILDDVILERGERRLFGPLSLSVRGPERIHLAGGNGTGKTSLMQLIMGSIQATSGRLYRHAAAAWLDQEVSLLDGGQSLLDNLRRYRPELDDNAAHAALARFAFRNVEALRLAGELSGGERLRAGLACVMSAAAPPRLLLMDEPTNHLDLAAVEQLEAALRSYDGALIISSHDAAFVAALGLDRRIGVGP